MRDGNDEEAVACVRDTSKRIIPREESSEESKVASSLDAGRVGPLGAVFEITNAEQEESHVKGKEEQEKGDRRLERANEENRGEDEPSLSYN